MAGVFARLRTLHVVFAGAVAGAWSAAGCAPAPVLQAEEHVEIGAPLRGAVYWVAPRHAIPGKSAACDDAFDGASPARPWCTPKHDVKAGDRLIAVASRDYEPFGDGMWGETGYTPGGDLAWLVCERPFACEIATDAQDGMRISASGWGVSGWVVRAPKGGCLTVTPSKAGEFVHHVAFLNNVVGPCGQNGLNTYPFYDNGNGPGGVDYVLFAGNLVWNAASGNDHCFSGISVYEPREWDRAFGVRIVITRNVSWANVDGPRCPGNTDGNGIIFDDPIGEQNEYPTPYRGGVLIENNLLVRNGAAGITIFNTVNETLVRRNTIYGGYVDPLHKGGKGLLFLNRARNTRAVENLVVGTDARAANGDRYYGVLEATAHATNVIDANAVFHAAGDHMKVDRLLHGLNLLADPRLAAPFAPLDQLDCNGWDSAWACARPLIEGFKPTDERVGHAGVRHAVSASDTPAPDWVCALNPPGPVLYYCDVVRRD